MKPCYYIGAFFLFVMMGCARFDDDSIKTRQDTSLQPVASPELSVIDSLMWQRPDSALAMLLPCFDTCRADVSRSVSTTHDRHYAHLLQAELLYKNDSAQTNRAELQQAVAYYDSLLRVADTRGVSLHRPVRRDASNASDADTQTIAFLDARAHYINGVGYYERDSIVEACKEYILALEIMEERFGDKEVVGKKARFMAYTYNRLGDMFSSQFMMEPSLACYEQSLVFCKIAPTSRFGVANTLYRLGLQYDKLGQKGKAREYYSQALDAMPILQGPLYRDIVTNNAFCDYQIGLGMEQSMAALKQVLRETTNEKELLTRYLTIGDIFLEEGLYDSALFYLKPVFERNDNLTRRIQAASFLRIIYDSLGQEDKANEYIRFLATHKKTEGENKALVSQLESVFKDYLNQKQEQKAAREKREAVLETVRILVPISLAIAAVIIAVSRKRGKNRLVAQQRAHQMQQAALSGRLKRSNQELHELKDKVNQNEIAAQRPEQQAVSFEEEPVCCLIMERVNEGQFKSQMDCTLYKEYALDKAQVIALREAANRHFNQFTSRLAKAYPELTKGDLDYCCLYLLGLTDADIAALMQKAYPTVSQRSRKMRTIFGGDNPLPITLRSFANNNLMR